MDLLKLVSPELIDQVITFLFGGTVAIVIGYIFIRKNIEYSTNLIDDQVDTFPRVI